MNICGIIIAKDNSNRFPGKNYYEHEGKPLFMHGVDVLHELMDKEDIYICTDSYMIRKYCQEKKIYNIINRYGNVNRDDEPYISVLKFAYQYIVKSYDIIISVLANSINHEAKSIVDGLFIMNNNPEIQEVRSFDDKGFFSGICIFRESAVLKPIELYNIAAIKSNGKEIHYKSELNDADKI